MARLVFHIERADLPAEPIEGEVHIWLYGPSPPYHHIGCVGSQALDAASRFRVRPNPQVIDFLSIAMAVAAADTFVLRADTYNRWNRMIDIVLPLAEPSRWEPLKGLLERALLFLSGDAWTFTFVGGGMAPPPSEVVRRRIDVVDLSQADCVALFSGGLDSAIGALELINAGHRPLLVSHAPRGDADHQNRVAARLSRDCQRVSVNTYPTLKGFDDDSKRTRSVQFLALAALGCQTMATFRSVDKAKLFICENGLIALNPPLTPRRLGSLSTRTAHPHFLTSIQALWDATGIPAEIQNPYAFKTKGEIVAPHAGDAAFVDFVRDTVSCGKWKRRNQQCGRCVPCLIRRASLHAGQLADPTPYEFTDLHFVMQDVEGRDDLVSVQSAIVRLRNLDPQRWVLQAGPLPAEAQTRRAYFDVSVRGMAELENYLRSEGFALD